MRDSNKKEHVDEVIFHFKRCFTTVSFKPISLSKNNENYPSFPILKFLISNCFFAVKVPVGFYEVETKNVMNRIQNLYRSKTPILSPIVVNRPSTL